MRPASYCYAILAAVMVLDAVTAPAHSTGINIFIESIVPELGLSRSAASLTWQACPSRA